jgi:hypothetical protein
VAELLGCSPELEEAQNGGGRRRPWRRFRARVQKRRSGEKEEQREREE